MLNVLWLKIIFELWSTKSNDVVKYQIEIIKYSISHVLSVLWVWIWGLMTIACFTMVCLFCSDSVTGLFLLSFLCIIIFIFREKRSPYRILNLFNWSTKSIKSCFHHSNWHIMIPDYPVKVCSAIHVNSVQLFYIVLLPSCFTKAETFPA